MWAPLELHMIPDTRLVRDGSPPVDPLLTIQTKKNTFKSGIQKRNIREGAHAAYICGIGST
jgi:hypothetical protein